MKLPQPLFAAVLLLSACAASAAQRTFDLRAPAIAPAPTAGEDVGTVDGLLRTAEAPAADAGALAPGDSVTLLLFDGEQVDLAIEEASATTFSGSRAFLGRTAGSPLRNAVLLADADGRLHARIQGLGEGRVLRVFPRGGATAVEESEPAPVVDEDVPAAPAAVASPGEGGDAPLPAATQQIDTIVDVLVGFDLGAKAWAENNGGGPTNFAESAVQNMNLALANSNLDGFFRFRLAGIAFVDDRASVVRSAYNLYGVGEWAVLSSAAAACGADVVTILIDTGSDSGTTGCGNALRSTTQTSYFSAINACAIRAVASGETMTHECGHNLGCGHADTPGQSDPGPQSFPYSSGYHFDGNDGKKYHTIMAYNWLEGENGAFQLANVFSSPDLTIAGVPAGTAEANDNRRVLTQTGPWASNWRAAVRPVTYDVFFTPATETPIDGTLDVTIEPGRSGLPIRYTLDGSAPTLSSALYSGPIRLTATTTIRAATVYNGALGPVGTARYFVPDLAEALDTPGLVWRNTSSYSPWTFQTTTTWDGSDAVQSPSSAGSSLETTVTGPTRMSFRYRTCLREASYHGDIAERLSVSIEGSEVWSAAPRGDPTPWLLGEVEIPSGSCTVQFGYRQKGSSVISDPDLTYGVWLDNVRFDALSRPPVLSPSTTDDESTARTFATGSQTVSISAPDGDGTVVYYTTDLSDPVANGTVYEGPFTVRASTRVRAVAVTPGLDTSVETAGLYLDRHRPVLPGEWTADVDGVRAAAAADSSARLILGLYSTAGTQSYCEEFRLVAEDPAFTAWCAANGVYLLVSDTSVRADGAAAKDAIVAWYGATPNFGPTLVAVATDGTTVKAKTYSMASGRTFGTETYQGTVDSLVACVAAIIGQTSPSAPTATPETELAEASAFPVSVTLSNPNASGTIRYTLDGSAPTRSSAAYNNAPVSVLNGQVLSAAVFPSSASDLSSPVLRKKYYTVAGFFGIPEDAFDWTLEGSDVRWRVYPLETKPTLRSGNLGQNAAVPYESVLRAVARKAGTLTFSFGDSTYSISYQGTTRSGGTSFFTGHGDTRTLDAGPPESADWTSFSVDVRPDDVLLWTRQVKHAGMEYENYQVFMSTDYYRCGAFLRNLVWTPARDATDTPVPVPFAWLEDRFPGEASSPEAYDALAEADPDGDGFATWKEYLCGTSPADGTDFLRATIRMEGATPVVGWNLKNPLSGAQCVVEGAAALPAKESDWTSPAPANATFFRVRVLAPGE